jgi:hypothetical protein
MRCICGELEAIKKYGHHPNCEIHTNGVHRSDSEIEIDRLKAENARLREALEDIAEKIDCTCRYCVGCNQGSKMIERAEEALSDLRKGAE